jgi:hypothetical protein
MNNKPYESIEPFYCCFAACLLSALVQCTQCAREALSNSFNSALKLHCLFEKSV